MEYCQFRKKVGESPDGTSLSEESILPHRKFPVYQSCSLLGSPPGGRLPIAAKRRTRRCVGQRTSPSWSVNWFGWELVIIGEQHRPGTVKWNNGHMNSREMGKRTQLGTCSSYTFHTPRPPTGNCVGKCFVTLPVFVWPMVRFIVPG